MSPERDLLSLRRHRYNSISAERFYSTQPPTTDPNPTTAPLAPAQQNTTDNTKKKMASDEDYAAFLEKANADPNEGRAKTQDKNKSKGGGGTQLKAVDDGASVPKELREAVKDQVFVSDADEPFEVVSLSLGGAAAKGAAGKKGEGLPDEGSFLIISCFISSPLFFLHLTPLFFEEA